MQNEGSVFASTAANPVTLPLAGALLGGLGVGTLGRGGKGPSVCLALEEVVDP